MVEEGDVVPQGLVAEDLGGLAPGGEGQAEPLAHARVVVGDVFETVPVGRQAEAHDTADEDLPEVQARAAGGLLADADLGGEQGEHLGFEGGMCPEPLEAGQEGWELVAAVERQGNLFDGDGLEAGLGGKGVAHKGYRWRMLRGRTAKSAPIFRTFPSFAVACTA